MSNNYIWSEQTNIIECLSYKVAYQLCRQMYRHNFYCETETVMGNTRIILLHKCKTDIILYVSNSVYDIINHKEIKYTDYIKSLRRDKKWLIKSNFSCIVIVVRLTIVTQKNVNTNGIVRFSNLLADLQQWYMQRVNKMTTETLIIDIIDYYYTCSHTIMCNCINGECKYNGMCTYNFDAETKNMIYSEGE